MLQKKKKKDYTGEKSFQKHHGKRSKLIVILLRGLNACLVKQKLIERDKLIYVIVIVMNKVDVIWV